MRKILSLLTMCLLASTAWAVDIVFDATVDMGNGSGTYGEFTIVKDGINIHVGHGIANGIHYRFAKGSTVTITSTIGDIKSVVFTCVTSGDAQYGPGCFTVNVGEYDYNGNIGTWQGMANPVAFTASLNQVRATKIIVTVHEGPVFSPPSGVYYGSIMVNISTIPEDARIYFTTDGSDPSTNSTLYTAPFSISNNTIVKAISELNGGISDVTQVEYVVFGGVYLINSILYIGSDVTSIKGLQVNPSAIYSFATVPPECEDNTFLGYDAVLHVPGASFTDYFIADYWCNFADIRNDAVEPASVSLSDNEFELMMGGAITLTATVSPNNATPNSVVWTTSNPQVAVVSDDGVVTPISEGECEIVATCLDKQAVCHVTVVNPISVILDQTAVTIEQTNQATLTAIVTPDGANSEDIIWTTSDANVATVNDGIVTAVGLGECDITASYLDKQAVCHVTVIETTIYITLDQHKASVLPNHMITITPTMTPLTTTLKVTSSNPNVAVARLVNDVVQVAGKAKGTTLIIVGSVDDMAVPDTCVVTVYTETGDVNSDGFIDINDVTELISIVLNGNSGDGFSPDVNGDEIVDINDITILINYVLVGRWPWEVSLNESFSVNGVTFTMVAVEGGTFTMGATAEQCDATDWEKPAHQVTLSSYCIGETEVTQVLWQAVMGSNPSIFKGDLQRPVEWVSWDDCQTFITRLNELTGRQFRLPTEAEWEYAAHGGNRSQGYKYVGSNDINQIAWYWDNLPSQDLGTEGCCTQPVATKSPNELGLYDMSGNVSEWCQDWYGGYSSESQTNPTGPASGLYRVFRNGSWNDDAWYCYVWSRYYCDPTGRGSFIGLRLAL